MITINMSEFQEAHSVAPLRGTPPGYVGYGEGGVLTEAVRRQPYSVVLLNEVEKAHPDLVEVLFQVFDKGRIEDGEGRPVDFRNTLILLTTNAASGLICKACINRETAPSHQSITAAIRPELNRIFKPAFLGRTLAIPPLSRARRGAEADYPLEARQDRTPAHAESPNASGLRRCIGGSDPAALCRSGKRSAQYRSSPLKHDFAGDRTGPARAHGPAGAYGTRDHWHLR